MKSAAIICEYNPFHNGHLYQIEEARRLLGEDTAIIAIMSGNYTQRADFAIIDKYKRAKIAVDCGISLVLELPFPYSISSAQYFASAGVAIANGIGADYLVFGSECGELSLLDKVARATVTEEFKARFSEEIKSPENKNLGYAQIFEKTCKLLFTNSKEFDIIRGSNDILGIEYLRAIHTLGASLQPVVIKRRGADFRDEDTKSPLSSACGIRKSVTEGKTDTLINTMPTASHKTLMQEYENDNISSFARIFPIISAMARLGSPKEFRGIYNSEGGITERLLAIARDAKSFDGMMGALATKKYTDAFMRRAILSHLLRIKAESVRELPKMTYLLAADSTGIAFLHEKKRKMSISILTKPADYVGLCEKEREQAELINRADSIYSLSKRIYSESAEFLCRSPYIKK